MTYTLDIDLKNKEAKSLVQYLKSLSYLKLEENMEEDIEISDSTKKLILNRVKTAKKSNFKPWSEIKKNIRHK